MKQRYRSGRYYEYLTIRYLKDLGYDTMRSAGSKGKFDIFAWYTKQENPLELPILRFIQVKSIQSLTRQELTELEEYRRKVPAIISLEVWTWRFRGRDPEIKKIKNEG